ncbi:DNA/RNA helicase domain-containing protein [Vibrio sinaloensis]|uniref:Schlafen group 3-like DNA/RNA helicase domain-containing protein n=1 Tax=Photobacterium sp. (strain ATCC 43367) TaxID=379097 RepID=A0A0A5HUB3_PHOS4|nr:DNA/RNA helicase domain-containing protein [Vibrio sinaloensis]KGY07044.1 hypothetical protein NM06_19155 [Vibrio sinaloensis]
MKSINILSLVQANASLDHTHFDDLVSFHKIGINDGEMEDLKQLVETVWGGLENPIHLNNFFVGYTIPQIGKEFDLLRFSDDLVVNIELKRESTAEKIEKQLRRNKYYLSYLERKIYSVTFVSTTGEFFILNENEELVESSVEELIAVLQAQNSREIRELDGEFDPSDYLVSPFNSTNKFIGESYFLTNQQENIKNQILKELGRNKTSFISLVGSAGTGKTLLAYDIVKEYMVGRTALIIHCGQLNSGHMTLIKAGWEIISIRNIRTKNIKDYDAIFIDEAQRIYKKQYEKIIDEVRAANMNCVFSYDQLQTLSDAESKANIHQEISKIKGLIGHKLSDKIRTNKEISNFIKCLFDKKRHIQFSYSGDIDFEYFSNVYDAKEYLSSLMHGDWEVIRFTPSQYNSEHHEKYYDYNCQTSHGIIGQEFDNVVIVLDKLFYYNDSNSLDYRGRVYYNPVKMLFQNITRTRKKLKLIIIDNEEILGRCMKILG